MNYNYLRKIIKGERIQEGYIVKSLDSCLGGENTIGQKFTRPHSIYKISFPIEVNNYKYEDYINEFKEILHTNGHKYSERIINVFTYIFVNLRDKSGITDRAWKKFSSSMFTKCNLHLEYPIAIEYDSNEVLHLRNYDIGKLDITTLRTTIRNETVSDYWEKYHAGDEDNLSKVLSFRRLIKGVPILDVTELVYKKFRNVEEVNIICDLYFEALTIQWFESFFSDLHDELLDSLIFGGADFTQLFNLSFSTEDAFRIAVYSNIKGYKKNGWVIPLTHTMLAYSVETQRSIQEVNKQLQHYYKAISIMSEDFHSLILTYRRLLGNGMRLLYQERVEEAFMSMWIALDTILKRYTDKSNTLKNRIAAITWYQSKKTHEIQYQTVSKLYELRNKYVHSGIEVNREDVLLMRDISQIVLSVLLNMHNFQISKSKTYQEWLEDIDKTWELYYKKQPIEIGMLEGIGVK